eukprot:1670994-Prymnesium_polylepis.1
MQFSNGADGLTYWLATWSWDALLYISIVSLSLVAFSATSWVSHSSSLSSSGKALGAGWLALAAFGFAALPLSSLASFFFASPSFGVLAVLAFHLLTGFGLVIADFALENTIAVSAPTLFTRALPYVFCLFPAFSLGKCIFENESGAAFAHLTGTQHAEHILSWSRMGRPLAYMLVEGVLFSALTLALQEGGANLRIRRFFTRTFERQLTSLAAVGGWDKDKMVGRVGQAAAQDDGQDKFDEGGEGASDKAKEDSKTFAKVRQLLAPSVDEGVSAERFAIDEMDKAAPDGHL